MKRKKSQPQRGLSDYCHREYAPLKDDQGEITGAINCFYDVTERKKAEELLRESVTERRRVEEALRESEVRLRLANEKLETVVQKRTARSGISQPN